MSALARPEQLADLLGIPFTPEQLAAATAPLEPAVIVAGAGSGKTSVMAARVVWLVGTGQVRPDAVLGLTFTNKAAGELAQRIRSALSAADLIGESAEVDAGEPVVSTYHAFAGRLVKDHGLRLGIEPQSRLLIDASRFQLAARVLRRHSGAIHHLTKPLRMIVGDLISLESEMSEHLVSAAEVVEHARRWLVQVDAEFEVVQAKTKGNKMELAALDRYRTVALGRIELAGLVEEYRLAKTELDAVDFGDQVALAARLAEESPAVGEWERAAAGVVLLDEYQDTSVAQRRMLRGLFGGGHPITAVGDPCQAIYGWRGASVANLDDFPEHFARADGSAAGEHSLAVNQRSGGRLLNLANTVAAPLLARHRVTELRSRPGREMQGNTVVALHDTWAEEAEWVAAQLADRVAAGQAPGECAVLVRSRVDIADLYAALIRAGLPVEVVGLGGLLSLPEVADVVATLEVLDDPTANGALIRLLSGPRHRLGVRDLVALGRRAQELMRTPGPAPVVAEQQSLFGAPAEATAGTEIDGDDEEALKRAVAGVDPCDITALADALTDLGEPAECGMSEEAAARCRRLGAEIGWLRRHLDEPLLDLIHRVVSVVGLDVEIAATPGAAASRRQETLASFLDVAAGFRDLDGQSSLTAFLAFLEAADEHERGLDSTSPSGSDAVSLLTAHKAKGLEWDVVAVPNLTNKVFPVDRLQGQWPKDAATLPAPLRGDASSLPVCGGAAASALKTFDAESREHLLREELRLGYVAFTRPRNELIASGHYWGPTQKKARGPSPFLKALKDHAEREGTEVQWAAAPPDGMANPQLDEVERHPWPEALDPVAFAERERAAGLVRTELAGIAFPVETELTLDEQRLFAEIDADIEALVTELHRDRPTVRQVELPATLTATQLMRLRSDPDELAREMLRPMPRRPVPAARRGTRFHAWIESLFEQRPLLDPGDLPGASDELLGTDEDLQELQEAFLSGPFASRQPCAVEAPFALALAGRVVRGRIDAVYDLGDGRWEVVDWKTGHEIADPLQLAVYRCAWAELQGIDLAAEPDAVSGAFVYVKDGRVSRPSLPSRAELAALLTPAEPAALPTASGSSTTSAR
jgi:DNA helicase-2/ATP-dependent DNA helicase PcrA